MGERDGDLPATSYAVLGLLTFGEMSGYDLMKLANRSIGFFWAPAKSQVYAELRRLVREGYATEREVEQEVRPDKRIYAISKEGEAVLRSWLEDTPIEPEPVKSTFLLKVFFGRRMSPDRLLAQLERRRDECREMLERYREIEREIKDDREFFYPYLTLRFGLAHSEATMRWCDEVLRDIEKEEAR